MGDHKHVRSTVLLGPFMAVCAIAAEPDRTELARKPNLMAEVNIILFSAPPPIDFRTVDVLAVQRGQIWRAWEARPDLKTETYLSKADDLP